MQCTCANTMHDFSYDNIFYLVFFYVYNKFYEICIYTDYPVSNVRIDSVNHADQNNRNNAVQKAFGRGCE